MQFDWTNPYPTVRSPVMARNVVATSHPLASQAGLRMLQQGGNANLYAIDIAGAGAFDLCPADACQVSGSSIQMTASEPPAGLREAAEAIARAAHLDVGGVEVMVDDRDGCPRFYDINALSNFVARPLDVLGWDPHDRLVDRLVGWIEEAR